MRSLLLFTICQLGAIAVAQGQSESPLLLDSIYAARGIDGTLDFAPEYRTYFPAYDDQGRLLEEIREESDGGGNWRPERRRRYQYEGNTQTLLEQIWVPSRSEWVDRRQELTAFENGLIQQKTRRVAVNDMLRNDRRWTYAYRPDEQQSGILLEQWNGSEWENLSRTLTDYNVNNDREGEVLQLWFQGNWRNVRSRLWQYADNADLSVESTVTRIWSLPDSGWVNELRQTLVYENNRWVRSLYEEWNSDTDAWENESRVLHRYEENGVRPAGQLHQQWDGQWENRGQVDFSFADNQYASRIQRWEETEGDWINFLRYWVERSQDRTRESKVGMQAWDRDQMRWENRNFTERISSFWSSPLVSSVVERTLPQSCRIPNPYPQGTPFSCDLPASQRTYQLELIDAWGRPVHRQVLNGGQGITLDVNPPTGMYVLRIQDGNSLFHIQRLIIP